MKVRELTISNYRAFEGETTFALSDRVTVIAGVNGRGKTALLDGLALLMARLLRGLKLMKGNQRTILPGDVHGAADSASLSMKVNCAGIPLIFGVSYSPTKRRVEATKLKPAVREQVVNGYGDPTRPDDQAPIAVYYTTDRAGFRIPRALPTTLPLDEDAAYTGALVNSMVDYRDFMARYRVWIAEHQRRTLDAFDRALKVFLVGFGDVEVQADPVRLTFRKGPQRLGLHQLSDGERAFIAVVADLVRRLSLANPELSDPLKGCGVVLIDELELHLHPRWQQTVIESLRTTFPNIQFVATTHSPFIVQSLREGELIALDPDIIGSYANRGLEEIATSVMGIESPEVNPRYLAMLDAAKEYFIALQEGSDLTGKQRGALKRKLNRLARPYADNPAYQALLELRRAGVLKE